MKLNLTGFKNIKFIYMPVLYRQKFDLAYKSLNLQPGSFCGSSWRCILSFRWSLKDGETFLDIKSAKYSLRLDSAFSWYWKISIKSENFFVSGLRLKSLIPIISQIILFENEYQKGSLECPKNLYEKFRREFPRRNVLLLPENF